MTASPDAAVIAACAEFERLERDYIIEFYINRNPGDGPGIEEQETLIPAACAPVTTLAALKARARAAVVFAPDLLDHASDDDESGMPERLVAAILRDLVGDAWLAELHGLLQRKERAAV